MVAAVTIALFGARPTAAPAAGGADADAVRSVVTQFGARLQQVSLLAPDAAGTLDAAYGPFVSPALLASWKKDPSRAPGRLTSSPWPDRIEIDRLIRTRAGYTVTGRLVYMTGNEVEHGGVAGMDVVVIHLRRIGGRWLISAYAVVHAPA
jgi:hypothetical protein